MGSLLLLLSFGHFALTPSASAGYNMNTFFHDLRLRNDDIEEWQENNQTPQYSYNGFERCDFDGWTCLFGEEKSEVVFVCDGNSPNARIWLWTARLPDKTSILTVKNCLNLEVHTDCTRGRRNTLIEKFAVVNVTNLEFLKPTRPGSYLHDNYDSPLLPQKIHIEKVKRLTFPFELFTKSSDECAYKKSDASDLIIVDTAFNKLATGLIKNYTINKLVFQQVFAKSVDPNALSVVANDVAIVDSTFANLNTKGFTFTAKERVLMRNNTFLKIQNGGLTVRTKSFQFIGNHAGEVTTKGFDIMARTIVFSQNYFGHLDNRAMENINFGLETTNFEYPKKFSYNFTRNSIRNLEPGSLHPNWTSFKDTCFLATLENNDFDCSCINFGWMVVPHVLGPKLTEIWDFYDQHIVKGKHTCFQNKSCSFATIIKNMADICSNKTDIGKVCDAPNLVPTPVTPLKTPEPLPVEPPQTSFPNRTTKTLRENSLPTLGNVTSTLTGTTMDYNVQKTNVTAARLYDKNPSPDAKETKQNIWFVAITLIIIVLVSSLAFFFWWYKKSSGKHNVTTAYKNDVENDDDNLIVINEHRNQLYDEKN